MQGTDKVHYVHLPMFYMANHRYQVIVTGDLPDDAMEKYKAVRSSYPNDYFTLGNIEDATLMDLIKEGGSFDAVINRGLPPDGRIIVEKTTLSNIHIVVQQSLATNSLQASYPTRMPFYLYGTPEQQHIDHMLLVAPDQQLNSDQVKLDLDNKLAADDLAKGVVAVFTKVYENSLQPM